MAAILIKHEVPGSNEFRAFMDLMGWTRREALGCLALLWGGSQQRGIVKATRRQVLFWCDAEGDPAFGERLINALTDELVGYLKKTGKDRLTIVGNAKHIAKIKAWTSNGTEGGKKTREKWRSLKAERNPAQDAEPNARANTTANALAGPKPFAVTPSLPSPSPSLHNSTLQFPSSQNTKNRDQEELNAQDTGGQDRDPVDPEVAAAQARLEAIRESQGLNRDGSDPRLPFARFKR